MENWVQEVVSKWKAEGVRLNQPATVDSIANAETILDFKFPDDFKELYLEIDGFKNLDWQEHMFYFWPLERIIEEFDESKDNDFVSFCDFLLASHYIGFRKSDIGIYKKYTTSDYSEVSDSIAQSFKEVVDMINSSSKSIY